MNYIALPDCTIVVILIGTFQHFLHDFFEREFKLSEPQFKEKVQSRTVWYGVVDGVHRLDTINELMVETPKVWEVYVASQRFVAYKNSIEY